jgi:hypothetical protein
MVTPCKGFAAKNTLQSVLFENGNLTMSMRHCHKCHKAKSIRNMMLTSLKLEI